MRENVESKTAWYVINHATKEFAERRMAMLAPDSEIVYIAPLNEPPSDTVEDALTRFLDEFEYHIVFDHFGNVVSSKDVTQLFMENAKWLVEVS